MVLTGSQKEAAYEELVPDFDKPHLFVSGCANWPCRSSGSGKS